MSKTALHDRLVLQRVEVVGSIRHWEKIVQTNCWVGQSMTGKERNKALKRLRNLQKEYTEIECGFTILSLIDKMEKEGL